MVIRGVKIFRRGGLVRFGIFLINFVIWWVFFLVNTRGFFARNRGDLVQKRVFFGTGLFGNSGGGGKRGFFGTYQSVLVLMCRSSKQIFAYTVTEAIYLIQLTKLPL